MRLFLKIVAALIVLVVTAAVVGPRLIPDALVKRQVAAFVETATGRDMTITGDVAVRVFPRLGAVIRDVTLANAPGASTPHMMTMKEMYVRVAILPLLYGDVEIAEFDLHTPVINLEVAADGAANWQFDVPAEDIAPEDIAPEDIAADDPVPDSQSDEDAGDLTLADIEIIDGHIQYRDNQSGTVHEVSDVDVFLALPSLDEPTQINGALTWNGERITLDASASRLRAILDETATTANITLT